MESNSIRVLSPATCYSVTMEARAPDSAAADLLGAADLFMDLLQDHDGIVSAGTDSWDVTISVPEDDPVRAISAAAEIIRSRASEAGMPGWPIIRIEAVRQDILEQDNARPTLPDLVSVPEAAQILGVSTQRIHELAHGNVRFPKPAYELKAGNLWLRAAIEAFDARWERKPGRPRKVKVVVG
jgi:predicted DNA-binding transcriptional regulator AlpA